MRIFIVFLLDPGSGKSTILRVLLGLEPIRNMDKNVSDNVYETGSEISFISNYNNQIMRIKFVLNC